jgi:hypothetical protein
MVNHYVVRKSTDHGLTWTTIDEIPGSATGVAVDSLGHLVTGGQIGTNAVIRTSLDKGATWTTTDTFLGATATSAYYNGSFTLDSGGDLYASATVRTNNNNGAVYTIRKLSCH